MATYDALDANAPGPTGDVPEGQAAIYYAGAVDELNEATTATDALLDELIALTADALLGAISNTNGIVDELIGAADVIVTDAGTQLSKVVIAVGKDVAKQLAGAVDSLNACQCTPPYHTSDMEAALSGDFMVMVAQGIPALRPYLGVEPTPYVSDLPPTEVPTDVPTGSLTLDGSDYAPTVPPVVYQHATPGAPVRAPGGAPAENATGTCCPAPVNVTVVVPPIAVTTGPAELTLAPVVDPTMEGKPYVGTPPAELISGGIVRWSSIANTWVYTGRPSTPPPPPPPQTGSTPPPPPPPPPGTSFGGQVPSSLLFPTLTQLPVVRGPKGIYWNDPTACAEVPKVLLDVVGGGDRRIEPPAGQPTSGLDNFIRNNMPLPGLGDAIAWTTQKGEQLWGKEPYDWMRKQWDSLASSKESVLNGMANTTATMWATTIASPTSTPNPGAATYYGARLALANKVEANTGFPMLYLYQSDMYLLQYSNPQFLPNQIRTDDAFLSGQIDEGTWLCWTRANGNLPEPSRRVMIGNQQKPGLQELITLYRRGHLKLEDLPKRARELGVLEPAYLPEWLAVTKQLPTQSDLVRFMVRDASDDAVAKKYDLDKGFNQKFTPQMKAWADALGLDDTYFRYDWRAHWHVPSYTQLSEMLHRCRPDRPEITEWDAIATAEGKAAAEQQLGPRPVVVTLDDVRQAIEIDDYAPAWVDPVIAIGYTPINRTDAVRAYQIGAFTEDRLYHAFRDVGYSVADANTLVNFHRQDKARKRANVTGTWSMRKITKYFKAGTLSRDEAANLMRPLTASLREVEDTLQAAEQEISADTRASAVRGVKRGYFAGEHNSNEALQLLIRFGVDKVVADRLLTSWTIDRDTRYKRLTATQTADGLKKGLIGVDDARRRLKNIGYVARDADIIIAKALGVRGEDDGMKPEEVAEEIQAVVRSKKEAKALSDPMLLAQVKLVMNQATRLIAELNARRAVQELPRIEWEPWKP